MEATSPRPGVDLGALGLAMITNYALRGDTIDTELLYWVVLPTKSVTRIA